MFSAALVFLFAPVLFFGKALLPSDMVDTLTLPFSQYYGPKQAQNPYVSDAVFQFYPYKLMLREAWLHGNFAFWNPLNFCGYPQYAETMATNFDVLNVIFLLFPMSFAFTLYCIAPLFIAGAGCYVLLRSYGIRVWIARTFGISYMLSALFITHLQLHYIPGSMCWVPFICYFLKRYFDSQRRSNIVFTTITLTLGFLGGNIQTASFLLFILAVFCLSYSNSHPISWPVRVRAFGVVTVLSFCLGAFMWLPTIEFVVEVIHHGVVFSTSLYRGYDFTQRIASIPLSLTFFLPQLAGTPRGLMLHSAVGVFPLDFEGAIGFLPLLLAAFGLWKFRSHKSLQPFVWLMVLGLLIPIGTPLSRYLYHRFFAVFVLGAVGVGAITFNLLLQNPEHRNSFLKWIRVSALAIASLAVILLVATFVIYAWPSPIMSLAIRTVGPRLQHAAFAEGNELWLRSRIEATVHYFSIVRFEWIAALLSCALIIIVFFRWNSNKLTERWLLLSVWALTTFQLVLFARSWLPMTDSSKFPLYPSTPETNLLRSRANLGRTCFFRQIEPNHQTILVDNQNVVYGIPEATGYESLTLRCLYNAIGTDIDSSTIRLLSRFNVTTIGATHAVNNGLLQPLVSGPIWMYDIVDHSPRIYLCTHSAVVKEDSSVLIRLRSQDITWPSAIFTVDENAPQINLTADTNASAKIIWNTGNQISIHTSSKSAAYLVLADTYYPGWDCEVDGRKSPIYRCNFAMRSIPIAAGVHQIILTFAPQSFMIGLVISGVTFLLLTSFSIITAFFRRSRV